LNKRTVSKTRQGTEDHKRSNVLEVQDFE